MLFLHLCACRFLYCLSTCLEVPSSPGTSHQLSICPTFIPALSFETPLLSFSLGWRNPLNEPLGALSFECNTIRFALFSWYLLWIKTLGREKWLTRGCKLMHLALGKAVYLTTASQDFTASDFLVILLCYLLWRPLRRWHWVFLKHWTARAWLECVNCWEP